VLEPNQQQRSGVRTPAIVIAISAAGLLLSLGLCGAGGALSHHGISGFLFASGVVVLFASIVGVVVGVLWLILAVILNISSK
jgi:hypothetical protein